MISMTRGCGYLVLWLALLAPSVALAEGVVHLKGGGTVRGQVMELIPNQYVNVLLADGESRRIAWADVERVDEEAQPSNDDAQPVPVIQEVVVSPTAPVTGVAAAPLAAHATDPARAEVLRVEIATLLNRQSQLDGSSTAVMMGAGYVGMSLLLPGLMILGLTASICEHDCGGMLAVGISIVSVSAIAMVVGVIGLLEDSDLSAQRSENARQIFVREQELRTISYDVTLGPQRADAVLRVRF